MSDKNEILYVAKQEHTSANKLSNDENADKVECVTIDEDIKEPVTFIKMDIEGSEYKALQGAQNHIKNETPKLAISIYHGYDDLWRLPLFIEKINPNYDFYLRHYGGNLIPTEFILLCKGEYKKC